MKTNTNMADIPFTNRHRPLALVAIAALSTPDVKTVLLSVQTSQLCS